MRKLKQILVAEQMASDDSLFLTTTEILALDENGEIWFGKLETTEDDLRVVDWSPVNTPRDGAGFSLPQESFIDKWERNARERLKADADTSGETLPLATPEQDDASGTGGKVQAASDDGVEDGEGADSTERPRSSGYRHDIRR